MVVIYDTPASWEDISFRVGYVLLQHRGHSGVFKDAKGSCYLAGAKIWVRDDGSSYQNVHSRLPVTFPLTIPATQFLHCSLDPANAGGDPE